MIHSGCTQKNELTNIKNNNSFKTSSIIINAPEKAYFEELITFTASSIHNSEKEITYEWDFRDGRKIQGEKVQHIFKFENDFDIEYPLIYTVLLCVKENDEFLRIIEHEIQLFPPKYIFYLTSKKLTVEKPEVNQDMIELTGKFNLKPLKEISYDLEESVKIQECKWNITIHIKKPVLAILDKIQVSLYNKTGFQISEAEIGFKKFEIWKEKNVLINGEIIKAEEFKSIKISLKGLTVGQKINIQYGSQEPSQINFDFIKN